MNYEHAFHAGNPADVLKHSALTLLLLELTRRQDPLHYPETHAGSGLYALEDTTGEWTQGIGKLASKSARRKLPELIPYLDFLPWKDGVLAEYPGSPLIAQELTRAQDALVFCELHPEEHAALVKSVGRDRRTKSLALDGWTALKSLLPPKERRGLVLIDPPFEDTAEFRHIADGIEEAMRRFATGIYLIWYPVKNRHDTDAAIVHMLAPGDDRRIHRWISSAPLDTLPRFRGAISENAVYVASKRYVYRIDRTVGAVGEPLLAREAEPPSGLGPLVAANGGLVIDTADGLELLMPSP